MKLSPRAVTASSKIRKIPQREFSKSRLVGLKRTRQAVHRAIIALCPFLLLPGIPTLTRKPLKGVFPLNFEPTQYFMKLFSARSIRLVVLLKKNLFQDGLRQFVLQGVQ